MGLSTKDPSKESKKLGKKMMGVVARISYLSDEQMKRLKIKSITESTDIKKLIDNALKEIMSKKKHQFQAIDADAKKRSFVINYTRLMEMKVFLLEYNGITQDKLIYNAILKIIE